MTKEELKQEAEEKCVCTDEAMRIMYGIGYIDGAEPREKRIEELEESNRELQKLVQQREQRGLEVQEDLLKEKEELEIENHLLGERCNQLLKDKGNLTDELQELKETLAKTTENDEVAYETLKLHDQEEIGMLNSKVTKLEQQIEKMKEKHKQEILDLVLSNSSERAELEKENAELKEKNRQLTNEVEDLTAYCNQIGKIKTDVLKLFEHIVAR